MYHFTFGLGSFLDSIEHYFIRIWKFETVNTHACLAQLDPHQTCKPLMVSVVSLSPTGGSFNFLRHLNANFVQKLQKCQICVIYKNLEWIDSILIPSERRLCLLYLKFTRKKGV